MEGLHVNIAHLVTYFNTHLDIPSSTSDISFVPHLHAGHVLYIIAGDAAVVPDVVALNVEKF